MVNDAGIRDKATHTKTKHQPYTTHKKKSPSIFIINLELIYKIELKITNPHVMQNYSIVQAFVNNIVPFSLIFDTIRRIQIKSLQNDRKHENENQQIYLIVD